MKVGTYFSFIFGFIVFRVFSVLGLYQPVDIDVTNVYR